MVDDPEGTRKAVREATRKKSWKGKRYAAINPASDRDPALMRAVIRREGHLHGFTNQQVLQLYGTRKRSKRETIRITFKCVALAVLLPCVGFAANI